MELNRFVQSVANSKLEVDKFCKIKTYLPIQDKINFIQEYYRTLGDMFKDNKYDKAEGLIAFVIFNLMVIRTYTDVELDLSFESMDLLQKNDLINKIVAKIGEDYEALLGFIRF